MEEALTALLANVAGGKRYWLRAPQSANPPYVIMTRVSGLRDFTMRAASGYVASRIQIDCYAEAFTEVRDVARQVRNTLSGRRAGSIQGIFIDSEHDLPAADAGDVKHLFRTSLDIFIHHTE